MTNDITYLGKIIRVDSGTVEVEVSNDKRPMPAIYANKN